MRAYILRGKKSELLMRKTVLSQSLPSYLVDIYFMLYIVGHRSNMHCHIYKNVIVFQLLLKWKV